MIRVQRSSAPRPAHGVVHRVRRGAELRAEAVKGRLNRLEDKRAWVAYFNARVRLVDLSDLYNPREVGYYVPTPNETSHPVEKGLAYATDRTGAGLSILQRTGTTARSGT